MENTPNAEADISMSTMWITSNDILIDYWLTQASMPIIDGKVLAKIGQNHYILRSAQRTKMIELYRKMSMN